MKANFLRKSIRMFFLTSISYLFLISVFIMIRFLSYRKTFNFLGEMNEDLSLDYLAYVFPTLSFEIYYYALF